jgi:hypothetical protein
MCEYPEYPVWENLQYLVPVRRKSMTLLNRQLGAAPMPQLLTKHASVRGTAAQSNVGLSGSSSSDGTGNVSNVAYLLADARSVPRALMHVVHDPTYRRIYHFKGAVPAGWPKSVSCSTRTDSFCLHRAPVLSLAS